MNDGMSPRLTRARFLRTAAAAGAITLPSSVQARGEEYLTYPQRALFDRIGIRRPCPHGGFGVRCRHHSLQLIK